MDFFEILASDRYHIDMKILEILTSNCKRFRVYDIFKKWQIYDDTGVARYYIFFDNFHLE